MSSLFDGEDDFTDMEAAAQNADSIVNAPAAPEPRANPDLAGHEGIEAQILDWWNAGAMPHTLVLAGPEGIGKATLAFRIARFLLKNPAAGDGGLFGPAPKPESLAVDASDPLFARVVAGGHPDLLSLALTLNERTGQLNKELLVDEMREVPLFLRKTASEEGGWRVVIVDQAEKLNRNAQNALLKILEEPPPRALLILAAQSAGALLPTIRSRARVVQMNAPDAATFEKLMRKYRPDLSGPDIELLAGIAGNAPGRALALLDQGGMAAMRGTLDMLDTLPGTSDKALWTLAETLSVKGTPDPLAGMLDVSIWALQARALTAARRDAAKDVAAALQTLDSLERHRAICDKGNLDRRHLALGALRILQSGMKAA